MLRIEEESVLSASPERIWRFLVTLDASKYKTWHPEDHIDFCRLESARDDLGIGQRVFFKERIGKRKFGFSCSIAKSVPGRYVEFVPTGVALVLRLGRGYFQLTPREAGTKMAAVVELGWSVPGLGWVLDFAVRRIVDVDALIRHMREEAYNLDAYLASVPD